MIIYEVQYKNMVKYGQTKISFAVAMGVALAWTFA